MKNIIKNISSVENKTTDSNSSLLICHAETGTVVLTIFSVRKILINYQIEGISIPPVCEAACRYLSGTPSVEKTVIKLVENQSQFIAEILSATGDKTEIVIEKQNGNLAFAFNDVMVHGGLLGNGDTVIPRDQMRCIRENSDALPVFRFNFPLQKDDRFYGLGDKGGLPNRRNRRFRMFGRDALGYDAELSDPLYKSIPFFIKHNPGSKILAGLYFPESLIDSFDFGKESPFFYSTEIPGGPASYYIFLGNNYKELLGEYYTVTGFPALPPLFSFGFFGSSMNYTEPDDAADRILRYFSEIERKEIPCEGMYISSGYLKADDGNRYAFFWNKRKFPNPREFLQPLSEWGYNLAMNIKPGILRSHPWYGELRDKGYFICDKKGEPYVEFYWGGEASFVDFANPSAREWWKSKLKENYIENGCTGIWNDNNELELEDTELDAYKDRTIYANRMAQASYEAFKEVNPDIRPWIYTRSGYAGIQAYARTWTGDNVSDWKTLKFNQYQSISLGLSGIPFYGHDLGGFFGPVPEKELLLRSCQSGVFQPRFVIHSWRENGEPTEPWTYPDIFPQVKYFIEEHYRFIPYIYDCAVEAARSGVPLDRPLFLEFPGDPGCTEAQVHSMFGPSLLKILAVEPDTSDVPVYLPAGTYWYDPKKEILLTGGSEQRVEIPWDAHRWFARAGSVIPTCPGLKNLITSLYPKVTFLIFPPAAGDTMFYRHFEDDGRHEMSSGLFSEWEIHIIPNGSEGRIELKKTAAGLSEPPEKRNFTLELPAGFSFPDGSRRTVFNPADYPLFESFSISYKGAYKYA
ncbi:alpha-glucosidase [Spirochaetia bacterium]|nr:alpha-glucosidase [Spirochaetia bacterium]